jgi:hypothetical protein
VRLRASFYENYVYADEDAVGVSLRPLGDTPAINAVWIVEHCYVEGDAAPYIMIQSAPTAGTSPSPTGGCASNVGSASSSGTTTPRT